MSGSMSDTIVVERSDKENELPTFDPFAKANRLKEYLAEALISFKKQVPTQSRVVQHQDSGKLVFPKKLEGLEREDISELVKPEELVGSAVSDSDFNLIGLGRKDSPEVAALRDQHEKLPKFPNDPLMQRIIMLEFLGLLIKTNQPAAKQRRIEELSPQGLRVRNPNSPNARERSLHI